MINIKQFKIGLASIIVTIILCFYICSEHIIYHIEKHSKHPDYGNIEGASDNQYRNRKTMFKRVSYCSPWDSC